MDVTSMLNSASAARAEARARSDATPTPSAVDGTTACSSVVQTPSPEATPSRRTSGSRTPGRSRTPWDAGGYSLPLTLDTKMPIQPSAKPSFHNESPIDTSGSPNSPRHKFSDSYSSLSSCTSSMISFTHSRFSSLSTVSGFQALGSLCTDQPALESRAGDSLDSAVSRTSLPDYFSKRTRKDGGVSPTVIVEEPSLVSARRPGSPSDAMLISRGAQSSDRMSPQDLFHLTDPKSSLNFLAPPDLSKSHKRAISAPNFAAISAIDQIHPFTPQALQPTPPPSQQGDRRSSYVMDTVSASPAAADAKVADGEIKCMYTENCDTGSQPRKAISHIFGRNKLCTRMIPQHVWVHFCRKHYQRSRYRNAQEYARLQCDLVKKQVTRVQAWSDENKDAGQAGVVQDWSLSVRKREQKRIDDRMASGRKRPFRDDSEEDDGEDRAVLNGTAVPSWLLGKCGSGYSTQQIDEIVTQLKTEMDQGKLTQIPDIEILPNIITDPAEDAKGKPMMKRKTSGGNAHKRSQSVGVALRHDTIPMMRRISQPSFHGGYDTLNSSPVDMRQRVVDFPSYGTHMALPQVPEQGLTSMRRVQQLPHRPAFGNIRENQTEDSYFDTGDARNTTYTFGGPLPAPSQPRFGQLMGAQLDASAASQSYVDPRRPVHQRSQSEIGIFQSNPNFTFRMPSALNYPPSTQSYNPEPVTYDQSYSRSDNSFNTGPPGYYDDLSVNREYSHDSTWSSQAAAAQQSPYAMPRHTRHQSTSAVPQAMPRLSSTDLRPGGAFDSVQGLHRRQHSYAAHNMGYRPIPESQEARGVYSDRR